MNNGKGILYSIMALMLLLAFCSSIELSGQPSKHFEIEKSRLGERGV